jgi:signal recognition particle subunit SRP54
MFGLGGGMPNVTPEMMEQLKDKLPPGSLPPGLPATPPAGLGAKPSLPGLGSKPVLPGLGGPRLPGLGGFNPFGKKK